jgi:glutathione S-transferase
VIPNLAEAAGEALRAPFAVLDKHLAGSANIVGDRFTVADINTAEVFRYAMPAPELFEAAPRVKAWLAALACIPDPAPGVRSESGYFRSLMRRCGDGTEGQVDGGDHRLLA